MTETFMPSGITENTPGNIVFGAATVHKGLFYGDHYVQTKDTTPQSGKTYYLVQGSSSGVSYVEVSGSSLEVFESGKFYCEKYVGWNAAESIIGATSGGSKLTITPEFKDIELDGATVKVKGLAVKIGETAAVETNIAEVTASMLKSMVVGEYASVGSDGLTGYTAIRSRPKINEGDYIKNFGIVGRTLDDRKVIVTFDNALCTSGLEIETKNKEGTILKARFECYADLSDDPTALPYHIYYPNQTA
ncbi:MAG: hypothetical protein ACI4I9_05745 [Porcipelethomonas sp.]